jgi:hypothetical protein
MKERALDMNENQFRQPSVGVEQSARMGFFRRNLFRIGVGGVLALLAARSAGAQEVTQQGAFAHVVFGSQTRDLSDRWTTEFTFSNIGTSTAALTLRWYAEDGSPMFVPIVGIDRRSVHTFNVLPQSTLTLLLDDNGPLVTGWASVEMKGSLEGQGTYRWRLRGKPEYNAALPMTRSGSQSNLILLGGGIPVSTVAAPRTMVLPFNNAGHITGVAFANTTNAPKTLSLHFLSETGVELMTQVIPMGPGTHLSFALGDPRLSGQRGVIRVDGDAAPFSAIVLSFVTEPEAGPFTTLLPIIR